MKLKQFITKTYSSPIRFFIVVGLVFGLMMLLITPPFQAPDEQSHFLRAYQISEFNPDVDVKGDRAGGELPLDVHQTFVTVSAGLEFRPDVKYDISKNKAALAIDNTDEEKFYDFGNTALYPPISYLPQSIGMLIGHILSLPPLALMYAGRLANLLAWLAMFATAIHFIPRKKWALAAVGLVPMAIFQAGSLSSDVMAVGVAALFISYTLHLLNKKKLLPTKQLVVLLGLAILLALCKQIMFVLLLVALVLPAAAFGGKKKAALWKGAIVGLPILMAGAWYLISSDASSLAPVANGQVPAEQIKSILTGPLGYVSVLWNTYFFVWGDEITRSLIGNFGWVDTPLSLFWIVFGYLGLAILMLAGTNSKTWLSRKQKIIIASVGVLFWLAVSTALYAFYSPVDYSIIIGLQGRYFIPLAILAVPLLVNKSISMKQNAYLVFARIFPVVMLTASVITIFYRYYIVNV